MHIRASSGWRGCPGMGAGDAAVPTALSWHAMDRGAEPGPERLCALPFGTQCRTGKKASEHHPANSIRRVAKYRWLCGLCWTRAGRTQALSGNPAGSPEQTLRRTETDRVGGGVLGRPAGGEPSARSRQESKTRSLRWNMLDIRNLKIALPQSEPTGSNLIKPNQTKSNQIKPKIMKDEVCSGRRTRSGRIRPNPTKSNQ